VRAYGELRTVSAAIVRRDRDRSAGIGRQED